MGNCQGVVGAELAVSGAAMGAALLVFNGSFNGAGRCFVRGVDLVPPPFPNDTFVAVTADQGHRRGVCQRSRRRQDHQQNVRCGTSSAFDETTIRDPSAISTAERGGPSLLARHDDTS